MYFCIPSTLIDLMHQDRPFIFVLYYHMLPLIGKLLTQFTFLIHAYIMSILYDAGAGYSKLWSFGPTAVVNDLQPS